MARIVTVTLTYDMDDEDKPLSDELRDWLEGNVNVMDLFAKLNEDGKTCLQSEDNSLIMIREGE
jgi:hypothetical protein